MLFRTQGRKSKKIIENYHRQQLTEGLFKSARHAIRSYIQKM